MKKLYLAYGANTNLNKMAKRCPNAVKVRCVEVLDYQLVFRGVADIERCEGKSLWGVLWHLTNECEKALDSFEGFPFLYGKEAFEIPDMGTAMYYTMNSDEISPPSSFYFETIKEGYLENQLPLPYLIDAYQRAHIDELER